jgi:hypothetical protein
LVAAQPRQVFVVNTPGDCVFQPVGSTSWHNRHLTCFRKLNELLCAEAVERPVVVIVGPGAVTRAAGWLLNDAAAAHPLRLRKLLGDAARYGDQVLRRIPGLRLRSLEPVEVESSLAMPHRLVVVDCSRRVLAAVSRGLPHAECHQVDIAGQPLPVQGDVVIAFNVICRLDDPPAGMARVAAAVRPGGWLLMDERSARTHLAAYPEFSEVAPKIHRRQGERE